MAQISREPELMIGSRQCERNHAAARQRSVRSVSSAGTPQSSWTDVLHRAFARREICRLRAGLVAASARLYVSGLNGLMQHRRPSPSQNAELSNNKIIPPITRTNPVINYRISAGALPESSIADRLSALYCRVFCQFDSALIFRMGSLRLRLIQKTLYIKC